MEPVPKTLDWVKARAECSIEHLFLVLTAVVEGDTKAAQARAASGVTFQLHRPTTESILVVRTRDMVGITESEAVAFEYSPNGTLRVQRRTPNGQNRDLFLCSPHVDVTGACKFQIGDVPMEPWQISKRGLEDLFFKYRLSSKRSTD